MMRECLNCGKTCYDFVCNDCTITPDGAFFPFDFPIFSGHECPTRRFDGFPSELSVSDEMREIIDDVAAALRRREARDSKPPNAIK